MKDMFEQWSLSCLSKNHVKNHGERPRGYGSMVTVRPSLAGANKTGLSCDERDTDLIHDCDKHLIKVNSVVACTKRVGAVPVVYFCRRSHLELAMLSEHL